MNDFELKQKIKAAYSEPRAPESLISSVILRARAVTMGENARAQLDGAPMEKVGALAARVLIGQLAMVSELPKGSEPELLARDLEQAPAFQSALKGGNVANRLNNGDLIRQITEQQPDPVKDAPELSVPKREGPMM